MNKLIVGLATVLHLIPHPLGVSPIGATALYAGANGPVGRAWLIPLIPLTLAGLLFGFQGPPLVMAFVFAGFALCTLIGRRLLHATRTPSRYGLAVVGGAVVFFLLSNLAIWLVGYYPPTINGLLQCYVKGLPYLFVAAIADAAYCFLLFGLHELAERYRRPPQVFVA